MNGKELVAAKHKLNIHIEALLTDFTQQTGLLVKDIKIKLREDDILGWYYGYPETVIEWEEWYYENRDPYIEE